MITGTHDMRCPIFMPHAFQLAVALYHDHCLHNQIMKSRQMLDSRVMRRSKTWESTLHSSLLMQTMHHTQALHAEAQINVNCRTRLEYCQLRPCQGMIFQLLPIEVPLQILFH